MPFLINSYRRLSMIPNASSNFLIVAKRTIIPY
jgi:hypothetical protein